MENGMNEIPRWIDTIQGLGEFVGALYGDLMTMITRSKRKNEEESVQVASRDRSDCHG